MRCVNACVQGRSFLKNITLSSGCFEIKVWEMGLWHALLFGEMYTHLVNCCEKFALLLVVRKMREYCMSTYIKRTMIFIHAIRFIIMSCCAHFITINACCDNAFIISHEQVHTLNINEYFESMLLFWIYNFMAFLEIVPKHFTLLMFMSKRLLAFGLFYHVV